MSLQWCPLNTTSLGLPAPACFVARVRFKLEQRLFEEIFVSGKKPVTTSGVEIPKVTLARTPCSLSTKWQNNSATGWNLDFVQDGHHHRTVRLNLPVNVWLIRTLQRQQALNAHELLYLEEETNWRPRWFVLIPMPPRVSPHVTSCLSVVVFSDQKMFLLFVVVEKKQDFHEALLCIYLMVGTIGCFPNVAIQLLWLGSAITSTAPGTQTFLIIHRLEIHRRRGRLRPWISWNPKQSTLMSMGVGNHPKRWEWFLCQVWWRILWLSSFASQPLPQGWADPAEIVTSSGNPWLFQLTWVPQPPSLEYPHPAPLQMTALNW